MQEFVFDFEVDGVFYSRPKADADWMRWKETPPRTVANHALARPEFAAQLQVAQLKLHWTTQRKLADREADGYQILYELDRRNRVRRRLALYDGSFLLAKADTPAAE
ncbi:hypothetical protein [Silvimonas iriomotensis]|uniref:Uncharacterized protein n=1 Tax=Silvimonas iriomotensis TaxID=449662 RepID=A0ABQ2PAN0_9NEIS|nr:hypothetical protein [Silvimonas iriomotensis]GGP22478.1 hypothetical protein GCM10010970_25430 [Silvimonas iriomotensis]